MYDVYIVSPEHLLVQLAHGLSDLELTWLLAEFMGTYVNSSEFDDGTFRRRKPLTTRAQIIEHLDALASAHGVGRVRNALRYAPEFSASQMETRLALRVALPPSRGGYGYQETLMNTDLEVERIGLTFARGVRRPDILLMRPDGKMVNGFRGVGADYDGVGHLSSEIHAVDLRRSNELLSAGFKGYTINYDMYNDIDYMDGLFLETIRKDLGLRQLRVSAKQAAERRRLRLKLWDDLRRLGDGLSSRQAESEAISYIPIEAYDSEDFDADNWP